MPTTSNKYYADLCDAFVSANIPFKKLSNGKLKEFLARYTNQPTPDESTLRKNYLPQIFDKKLSNLKEKVKNQFLTISIDETTDRKGRHVANVMIGVLGSEQCEQFLCNTVFLQQTNHSTISQAILNSLVIVFDEIPFAQFLLLLTDGASYMRKAYQSVLQGMFPNLLHVTCVVHGLHNLANHVRQLFPTVDLFIATCKKVFLKCPTYIGIFKEIAPDIPLPPRPTITRWGSWLEAVIYYGRNWENVISVIEAIIPESEAAEGLKTMVVENKTELESQILCISTNFSHLIEAMKLLQGRLCLKDAVKTVEDILPKIHHEQCRKKFELIVTKNTGYQELKVLSHSLLSGLPIPTNSFCSKWSISQRQSIMFAPITSVDVERSFSNFKNLLTDTRMCLTERNIRELIFCYCNASL